MRGGHVCSLRKPWEKLKDCFPILNRKETLFDRKSSLEEQLGVIRRLDSDILKVLGDTDETEEAAIANEIEEAGVMSADVKAAIRLLEEALQQRNSESKAIDEGASSNKSIVSSKKSVCVKLPKIELQKV